MELLIVTGMSGSGKTKAINALEDIGYFCIDNIPPLLIKRFLDLYSMSNNNAQQVAMVVDARGGELFNDLFKTLDELRDNNIQFKVLFLDADDDVLFHRYKESRRKHPLICETSQSLERAIAEERQMLTKVKEIADYIIDTSNTAPAKLKARLVEALQNVDSCQPMLVHCISFGFKNGLPPEADLVFDVRCLPNPFYCAQLKEKTGLDPDVRSFVLDSQETQDLIPKLTDLLDYLLPLYVQEGKSQLVVAMGCTGGRHRSVVIAEVIGQHFRAVSYTHL